MKAQTMKFSIFFYLNDVHVTTNKHLQGKYTDKT